MPLEAAARQRAVRPLADTLRKGSTMQPQFQEILKQARDGLSASDPVRTGSLLSGHDNCGACCGGCGGVLELTSAELDLLRLFAQLPFLPVARRWDSEVPVCLEEGNDDLETSSAAIMRLSQKRLIQLDYDIPLRNFNYDSYGQYPCHGSMALTAKGQEAVERLEIQGIEE